MGSVNFSSDLQKLAIIQEKFWALMLWFQTWFLTLNIFHSNSLATWGSSWVSIEAKFIKNFHFLGFRLCLSLRIEQTSKNHPKMTQFGWILDVFEDFSILAEKQRLKPRKSNSLMNFASLDAQLDPQLARLEEWNESGVKNPLCKGKFRVN